MALSKQHYQTQWGDTQINQRLSQTISQSLLSFKSKKIPALKVKSLTKKSSAVDTYWKTGNQFSPTVNSTPGQSYPRSSWPTQNELHVFCVCFVFVCLFYRVLIFFFFLRRKEKEHVIRWLWR